jgi:hypothetical protein
MSRRRRVLGYGLLLVLAFVAGIFKAEWRNRGRNVCRNCGAHGRYRVAIWNGEQLLTCHRCEEPFLAEVKYGRFTLRNRTP